MKLCRANKMYRLEDKGIDSVNLLFEITGINLIFWVWLVISICQSYGWKTLN